MASRRDPLRITIQVVIYIVFYMAAATVLGQILYPAAGYLAGITLTSLLSALVCNAVAMRIYEHRSIADAGLGWNHASGLNFLFGLLGGAGAASLVLVPALVSGVASIRELPSTEGVARTFVYVALMLLFGSAGEEILFRGFGFQVLLRALGPAATIFPIGVIFALLHADNPNATTLGLINTAGFGILFGYAFVRSHDIWLPIGLHFGWNFTLPLFGADVSGLRIRMTGYTLEWRAGTIWSGGAYGPEASILTSGVLVVLFVFLWKAAIRRQYAALVDPPAEITPCEPGSLS